MLKYRVYISLFNQEIRIRPDSTGQVIPFVGRENEGAAQPGLPVAAIDRGSDVVRVLLVDVQVSVNVRLVQQDTLYAKRPK